MCSTGSPHKRALSDARGGRLASRISSLVCAMDASSYRYMHRMTAQPPFPGGTVSDDNLRARLKCPSSKAMHSVQIISNVRFDGTRSDNVPKSLWYRSYFEKCLARLWNASFIIVFCVIALFL